MNSDLILVPVYQEAEKHWTLAVIDVANKNISYYDSLGWQNQECLDKLEVYLRLKTDGKSWTKRHAQVWCKAVTLNL